MYSFWNEIYNFESEVIATCGITEPEFINFIEFIEGKTKIEVEINSISGDNYTETFSISE